MAVFSPYTGTPYFENLGSYTDLATLITDVANVLLNSLASVDQWSEITAGQRWRMPTDGSGRFSDLDLVKASATVLEVVAFDQAGVNLMPSAHREILFTSPATFHIFAGSNYCWVFDITNNECFGIFLSNLVGIGSVPALYTYGYATRTAAASAATNNAGNFAAKAVGAADFAARAITPNEDVIGTVQDVFQTHSGADLVVPVEITAEPTASDNYPAGHISQMTWVDDAKSFGDEVPLQLDDETEGIFVVLPLPSQGGLRMAVRKS